MQIRAHPAGRYQYHPFATLGELVGELHGDAAAQGMADHCHPVDTEHRQKVTHPARVSADGIVTARLVGLTVTEQVRHNHRPPPREQRNEAAPALRVVPDSVDEQQRRATARPYIGPPISVHRHISGGIARRDRWLDGSRHIRAVHRRGQVVPAVARQADQVVCRTSANLIHGRPPTIRHRSAGYRAVWRDARPWHRHDPAGLQQPEPVRTRCCSSRV